MMNSNDMAVNLIEGDLFQENSANDAGGFVRSMSQLQQRAIETSPPIGSGLLPARGHLTGPAFFPEGLGICKADLQGTTVPKIMAIGHNFGCVDYRDSIHCRGREDDKATWRNLNDLLRRGGTNPDQCFRTNWFIGLLPGNVQTGKFLRRPDPTYEAACNRLLIAQIRLLKPRVILILGPEVASRAYQIIPALGPWRGAKCWLDIDRSAIGHSLRDVVIPEAGVRSNIAALLHPSFGAANEGRRMKNMLEPMSEAEIVRVALTT